MTDEFTTYTLAGFEAKARVKIDEVAKRVDHEAYPGAVCILTIFKTQYAFALTVDKIVKIGTALSCYEEDVAKRHILEALPELAKLKFLRKGRKTCGKLDTYEVRF